MNTCATCRFWGLESEGLRAYDADSSYDEVKSEHRLCLRIEHGNQTGVGREFFAQPAVVTDGSGYAAVLRTLPTFGCSLWERKEPTL